VFAGECRQFGILIRWIEALAFRLLGFRFYFSQLIPTQPAKETHDSAPENNAWLWHWKTIAGKFLDPLRLMPNITTETEWQTRGEAWLLPKWPQNEIMFQVTQYAPHLLGQPNHWIPRLGGVRSGKF